MPEEIVGRGTELAAVERFVERARSGLSALVLEGDAGIGKTTIWEAAVRHARIAGFTVLTTGPARSEQGLTLGGLTDLLTECRCGRPRGLAPPTAPRYGGRAPPGRAVRKPARPADAVGRGRRGAPAADGARPGPHRRRRRSMARRELGIDRRVCHPETGRPAAGLARVRANRACRRCARSCVCRWPRGHGTDRAWTDVARITPPAHPVAARPVAAASRARPDRGRVRRQPSVRARDRPRAARSDRLGNGAGAAADPRTRSAS